MTVFFVTTQQMQTYVGCEQVPSENETHDCVDFGQTPVDVLSHMIMQTGLKYLSVARNILW